MLGLALLVLVGADDPLTVRWDAPVDRCVSAAEVERRLRERLGPRLPGRDRVAIAGTVTEHDDGLRLRLRVVVDDEVTERELEAPVCEELLDAAVLIASLTVGTESPLPDPTDDPGVPAEDPTPDSGEVGSEPQLPEPTDATESFDPPASPRSEPPPPTIPERNAQRRPWLGAARLGAGVAGGQIPGISAIITAGASLHGSRWITRLDFTYAPRRRALAPDFEDRGAFIQAWHFSLDGGLRWPLGKRVHLPATLGLEIGALHGRGYGVATSTRRAQPWIAPAVSVGIDIRLTARVGLWAAGRLSVPVVRPAFEIEGRGTVFRVERISPRGAAGIMVTWP
ncbi:MAG: hypothetical protein AAGF11_02050 [Myxococcota bacterium]